MQRRRLYTLISGLLGAAWLALASMSTAHAHDMEAWAPQPFGPGWSLPHDHANAGAPLVPAQAGADACQRALSAFARFGDMVTARCEGGWLLVDAPTGLPRPAASPGERIMVGITAWIQRVPLPFHYRWRVPLSPQWLAAPQAASPRGPIAFAVDGVPIFHYDRRPDANTDPARYEARHDTVPAGELDQCGGHAGQGDDYHYHYPPVCLVDPAHLDQPIGFGLDGIPIYFGTGGSAFFGGSRLSGVNNLPPGGLDPCNGARQPDGTYVYYTTATPPYVLGCHHAVADPSLRIEPRPLRDRPQRAPSPFGVGQLGEPVRTLVTDFRQEPDGWYVMEFSALSGGGTSAVRYRPAGSGNDCWVFEHRVNAAQPGPQTTACR